MSFQDELRKSLKTKEQLRDEAADGIVLGEPFLHVTDGDEHLRRMAQRVRRRCGKLSCKIENTANRHIYAHVAVDYECRM